MILFGGGFSAAHLNKRKKAQVLLTLVPLARRSISTKPKLKAKFLLCKYASKERCGNSIPHLSFLATRKSRKEAKKLGGCGEAEKKKNLQNS